MKRQILHSKRIILSRSAAAISRKKSSLEVLQIRTDRLLRINHQLRHRQTLVSAQRLVHRQIATQTSMWYHQAMEILSSQSLKWLIKLHRLSQRPPGSPWCQEIPSRTRTRMMTRLMRALHCLWQADAAKLSKQASQSHQFITSSPKDNTYWRHPRRNHQRALMDQEPEESLP